MGSVEAIQAFGLDRLAKAELTEFLESLDPPLPGGSVTFERSTPTSEYGKPGTIVVILSIVALKAFLSWLALRPRNTRVTQQISLTMADGTVVTKTLDVESSAPGDANPELVRELLSMEGLTAEVRAALTSALSDG